MGLRRRSPCRRGGDCEGNAPPAFGGDPLHLGGGLGKRLIPAMRCTWVRMPFGRVRRNGYSSRSRPRPVRERRDPGQSAARSGCDCQARSRPGGFVDDGLAAACARHRAGRRRNALDACFAPRGVNPEARPDIHRVISRWTAPPRTIASCGLRQCSGGSSMLDAVARRPRFGSTLLACWGRPLPTLPRSGRGSGQAYAGFASACIGIERARPAVLPQAGRAVSHHPPHRLDSSCGPAYSTRGQWWVHQDS